jgi:general L-amino acid transport system substrate-binding protein
MMRFKVPILAAIALALPLLTQAASAQSSRLDVVKARGILRCGVNPNFVGFSLPDNAGQWRGFDVDMCRAVAAAALGDATKAQFIPLSAKDRFTALQTGEIDMLARNASWTLSRNTKLGINFVATNFYDGQAFMVKAASNIKSVADLNGASICVIAGTDTERNLADYFGSRKMRFSTVAFENADNVTEAYLAGRCDAFINDGTQLAAVRMRTPDPKAHVVLPESISMEPLAISVRAGDDGWANVVRWSFFSMVAAEELGLDSKNVRAKTATSTNPNITRFAGKSEDLGAMLSLDRDWAIRIVEQVGNYGESYDRNIKPLGIERGLNRLWSNAGLMVSPPMR